MMDDRELFKPIRFPIKIRINRLKVTVTATISIQFIPHRWSTIREDSYAAIPVQSLGKTCSVSGHAVSDSGVGASADQLGVWVTICPNAWKLSSAEVGGKIENSEPFFQIYVH
jgi:hypothetical protein